MSELALLNSRLDKRYDVLNVLGRGSYAEIFVARDTLASPNSPHNLVAIKALNVFLQNELEPELERTLVENFQNEAVALDRVRHPNIISRLGHGTARDLNGTIFHYLVLEYLEGGDLQRACRERRLSIRNSLKYIEQVCSGLRHAHSNSVIHRDVKPQNLLLTKDGETVKIADFGVARIHHTDSPITRVGTNIYAPPEHSPLANPDEYVMTAAVLTPAADVYSLAKSIYTLVSFEAPRPFANKQITELPGSIAAERWAPELTRVLRRATSSDPSLRHQSVDEFWHDLEGMRRLGGEYETATLVRPKSAAAPQPHVSRGYNPNAPIPARFQTSREHNFGQQASSVAAGLYPVNGLANDPRVPSHQPLYVGAEDFRPQNFETASQFQKAIPPPKPKRRFIKRAASFAVFLMIFAGVLFATHAYLRNAGILPPISTPFTAKTGRANTDINLRPSPGIDNDPIGLVTKNSRIRVVNSQNNWYQVDVIEQGRVRQNDPPVSRGWLNGKYVDLD